MDIYRSTHVELLLTQHKAQTTLHFLSLSLKKAKNEHRHLISLGSPITKFYIDSNKKKPFVKRITLAKIAADILEHVL